MASEELSDEDVEAHRAHLNKVADGCGCAEVWEYLSDQRRAKGGDLDESELEEKTENGR